MREAGARPRARRQSPASSSWRSTPSRRRCWRPGPASSTSSWPRSRNVASRIGCGSKNDGRRWPRPARARDAAADGVRVAADDASPAPRPGSRRRAGRGAFPRRRLRGDQHGHGVDDGDRARRRRARAHRRAPGPARRRGRGSADRTRPRGRGARPRHARACRRRRRRCTRPWRPRPPTKPIWPPPAASTSAASGPPGRPSRTSPARWRGCGSLEEMDAARAAFGDGARMLLAGAHDAVGQHGALADYLDVDPRYERAVEAVLGDLLQHVVVDDQAQAHAGFALVRSQGAGRCGFIVTGGPGPRRRRRPRPCRPGAVRLPDVVQVSGPFADSLQAVIGDAVFVGSLDEAASLAATTELPVVTADGDVYRGAHVVSGGTPQRGPRHPGDQARDQGPARDGVERPRRAGRAARRDRRLRHGDDRGGRGGDGDGWPTPTATRRRSSRPRPSSSAPWPTRRGCGSGRISSRPRPAGPARRSPALDARQADAQASIARLVEERATLETALARRAAPARRRPRPRAGAQPARRRGPRRARRPGRARRGRGGRGAAARGGRPRAVATAPRPAAATSS